MGGGLTPCQPGDPEKWPEKLGGLTRAARRSCKGSDPVMAEPLVDPRVPGEIPLLEMSCKETGRDPVKLLGGPASVRLSPCRKLGIPLRRPSPFALLGRDLGKPGCPTRDRDSTFPFSTRRESSWYYFLREKR